MDTGTEEMNDLIDNDLIEDEEDVQDCLGTFECEERQGVPLAFRPRRAIHRNLSQSHRGKMAA
jgi:hypothetical protein